MQAHWTCPIGQRSPRKDTRTAPVAVIGAILGFVLVITSAPALADQFEYVPTPGNPTVGAGEAHRYPRLGEGLMNIGPVANHREQRVSLIVELQANLDDFDRMERSPGLFTEDSQEHPSTLPWGCDALVPDY